MASTLEVDQVKHSSGVAFTLPQADGSAGHLLKTNGSRVLSFVADTDTGITYRVQRVEDSKVTKTINSAGEEVPLEMWQVLKMKDEKVLSEVFHPQHLKRSYMRRFLSRKSLQYAVATNIFKYGIKPSMFFTKPFERAFKNLPPELQDSFGIDIENAI